MLIDTDDGLASVFKRVKRIALVGASVKPERPSHKVMQCLLDEGFEVIPVNPGLAGQTLLGCEVFGSLEAISEPVDMVDVFRQPSLLPDIVQSTITIAAPLLWTQLDIRHEAAEEQALEHGIDLVVDRCPAIEIPRLRRLGLL